MLPETVSAIIERIQKNWRLTNDVEITLEANPTSVEANRFKGFRQAGVNRISMGIQALNDADLKLLGRLHTVSEAEHAFDIARTTFDRVSFDLIYARQNQSLTDWEAELTRALTMAADHLSLYQLTIEDGTAFGERFARGGLLGLPHEDLSADLYELTQTITEAHGFAAYEVSNHATPGQESRHNLIYWRGGDYVGVGPGAHGRFDVGAQRKATETHLAPAKWLESVSATGSGETNNSYLTKEEQALEYLLMSLRLAEGCDLDWLRSLDQDVISDHKIKGLVNMGHLEINQSKLAVPARSKILLNSILAQLVT